MSRFYKHEQSLADLKDETKIPLPSWMLSEKNRKAELPVLGRLGFKRKNFRNIFKSLKDNMKQKKIQA